MMLSKRDMLMMACGAGCLLLLNMMGMLPL